MIARPEDDHLVAEINKSIDHLMTVKARLPLIQEYDAEIGRRPAKLLETQRNPLVYQLLRDSYDMIVIDLCSLSEGMVRPDGVLNMLQNHLDRLRDFSINDVPQLALRHLDDQPDDEGVDPFELQIRQEMLSGWNTKLTNLFGANRPINEDSIKNLIRRFRKDTKPTSDDRSRVRAHRYEGNTFDPKYFQTLPKVERQFQIIEGYLNDLLLVATKGTHHLMEPNVRPSPEDTAMDLADLITLGSINNATQEYGLVPETLLDPPRYYWVLRKEYLDKATDVDSPA